RSACAKVQVADAHVDLAALTHLAALLRRALNDRFTSSNAPLSGVSILSHDQNRGELHAMSNEAGAPLCTTTGRPVRSRTASDDRRHAGMVWAANGDTSGTDQPDDTIDPGACRQEQDRLESGGRSSSLTNSARIIWSARRSSTYGSRRLTRFCTTARAARCNTPCA